MIRLVAQHTFHPVGQGLFFTGHIRVESEGGPSQRIYRWAYDCGTHSARQLVKREVTRVKHEGRFNLLVLSHFDADHINGVADLIVGCGTDTVMLPYMPLWERLLIAFEQGLGAADELTFFFVNPAAYFASLGGEGFRRLIFVPRSDDGGSEPSAEGGPLDDFPTEGFEQPDKFQTISDRDAERIANDTIEMASITRQAAPSVRIEMLRQGGSAHVFGLWEFVPYNDPKAAPNNQPKFEDEVAAKAKKLLAAPNARDTVELLKDLKLAYDRHIGKSNRNRGSLFLYGGPIHHWEYSHFSLQRWSASDQTGQSRLEGLLNEKRAVFLTGDGTLKASDDFSRFYNWFRSERMARVAVFQVMHHGAADNTSPGRARQLDPRIAVFSSDPSRKRPGHPDGEVVKDFMAHNPQQADQHYGVWIQTAFRA